MKERKLTAEDFGINAGATINDTTPSLTEVYSSSKVASLIPDALADLSADTNNQRVSDTEKSTWNGKADLTATEKAKIANIINFTYTL